MGIAYFWIFLLLLAAGAPIVFALLIGPGLSLALDGETQYFPALLTRLYNGMDSFPLLAVPLFILAGELLNSGGITAAIVRFSQSLVGHVRGGLAHVNILSSMLFSGISGSAVADASAIGKMLVPQMEANGYRRDFAAAVTAAAAVMGPIIPPSGLMILYGFVMNVSIGALFAGGIIPGVLMGLGLMGVTAILARRYDFPAAQTKSTWRERGTAFQNAFVALLAPVILLGGLLSGIFTATEAAAVASFYGLVAALFILRTLKFSDLPGVFVRTAVQSGVVLLLVGAAVTFAWIITVSGMATRIAEGLTGISDNPLVLLFLVNLLLFVIGMFLDAGPAILILGPVLGPIFAELGVDPIHFAIVMCVNLSIGLATPPMGLVLFVAASVSGERIEKIAVAMLPYLAMQIAVLFLITYFPDVTMALPRLFGLAS
jgi:tripartite ATP-independent transporter DctM subunit